MPRHSDINAHAGCASTCLDIDLITTLKIVDRNWGEETGWCKDMFRMGRAYLSASDPVLLLACDASTYVTASAPISASAGLFLRRLLHRQGLPGSILLRQQRRLQRAGRRRVVHAGHLRRLLLPRRHLGPGTALLLAMQVPPVGGAGGAGERMKGSAQGCAGQ